MNYVKAKNDQWEGDAYQWRTKDIGRYKMKVLQTEEQTDRHNR